LEARRRVLRRGAAVVAMAALPARQWANVAPLQPIPTQQLGAVTGNDPMQMERFGHWLGRPQDHDLVAFNQSDWRQLDLSINFIADLGARVLSRRRRVHWSVPVAGWGAYDSVASGQHDDLYLRMAQSIVAAYADTQSRICVRPPWEFNVASQSQAVKSLYGVWNGRLYIEAYRRIVGNFRKVSPRFYFDWSPNIGLGDIDPELCYPGDDVVDVISLDVYYRKQFDDQGKSDNGRSIFFYRKTQPRGLDWVDRFAALHSKLIGVSEWGVDSNSATAYTELFAGWIKGLGPRLSHHNYWDRTDGGVNSRLSDGSLPSIGDIYRRAFGRGR
jgi:hypothetical protein